MKYLIIILLSCSCIAVRNESIVFDDQTREILHVNYLDQETNLTWEDVKTLGIDSVKIKYLEYNAER